MKHLEIWADSFHEGVWCCDNICIFLKASGFTITISYKNGFIPFYEIKKNNNCILTLTIYGSYKSWSPLPKRIKELLDWGKPDFIAYDVSNDNILFAVEETAATPTGNQAMQRCERQYGSAHLGIPYWYFVSEYGEHVDGGVRRDNIWPTIAALKLTILQKTPCIVLHYSDIDNVEDYNSGNGLNLLFSSLFKIIMNFISNNQEFNGMESVISTQYKEMIKFLLSQWSSVIDFLPSKNILEELTISDVFSRFALNKQTQEDVNKSYDILVWPTFDKLPEFVRNKQEGKSLIKYDALSFELEADISRGKCYVLSNNAGSGKPPKFEKIQEWVGQQKKLFEKSVTLNPKPLFTMEPEDFPETESGNRHITTSKNIVYLYDRWSDLEKSIEKAHPRLVNKFKGKLDANKPVFLYLSNSVKPGRLFGDPYTGQLSAFSTCFGKFDLRDRIVIVYFPHQTYTQAFSNGKVVKNKGTTLLSELTDYIIFNAGVAVNLKDGEVL